MAYFRLDYNIGLTEFFIDALLTHDINRLVQYAPHVERFIAVGRAEISTAITISAPISLAVLPESANQTAIDIFRTANHSGYKDIRNAARGTHGLSGIAFDKVSFTTIV